MREVILYIAMSLDGYIADSRGGVAWLAGQDPSSQEPGSYPGFIQTVDTVLLGYDTYHQIATELFPGGWPYQDLKSYVITHRQLEPTDQIVFTNQDLETLIQELRAQPGKNIWLCGGADLANQMLELQLIDRFCVSVIPTILGKGIRLFSKHRSECLLELEGTRQYNGIVDLRYRLRNAGNESKLIN